MNLPMYFYFRFIYIIIVFSLVDDWESYTCKYHLLAGPYISSADRGAWSVNIIKLQMTVTVLKVDAK